MLITASTVLDTPANVRRFVEANLAMGADHMFVFCDAPKRSGQREVIEELAGRSHVTCVPTDADWWRGDRPSRLNVRQRINVNAVVELMSPFEQVDWVFHVDADEVVAVDREVLASVPSSTPAVWLTPLEAVSTMHAAEHPTSFKRLLDKGDLQLLAALGVIDGPTNRALFHGHVLGKSGVRPSSGLRLTLHDAVEPPGRRLGRDERFEDPRLRVLHYDAVSGEEFVRKWRARVSAGPLSLRPDRAPLAMALRSLVNRQVSPEVAEKYLLRLYERTTQDDVESLSELGMLEEVDPRSGRHQPAGFGPELAAAVRSRLEDLRELPKRPFHINHGARAGADSKGRLERLRRRGGDA
jgi:hypothetical protein